MRLLSVLTDDVNREVSLTTDCDEFLIMKSDWMSFEIDVGYELCQDDIDRLSYLDEKLRCVKKAFVHLSYGSMSAKRLKDKLRRCFSEEAAEETVRILKEHSYLNDTALCSEYALNSYEVKKHGPIRIKSDLWRLGFTQDDISQAMGELSSYDHDENIQYLLEMKYPLKDVHNIKKAFDYLYRMGYPYDIIKEAVGKYFDAEL